MLYNRLLVFSVFSYMKKKKLKYLAVYREKFLNKEVLSKPSIENHKDVLTDDLALDILKYLELDDHLQLQFVSHTIDPYTGDSIPFATYSDGVYVWDTTLIHWVKKYKIQLPIVFLEHFSHFKGKRPKNIKYNVDLDRKMESIFLEKPHYFFK